MAQLIEANAIRETSKGPGRLIRSWLQNINHQTVNAPGLQQWLRAGGRMACPALPPVRVARTCDTFVTCGLCVREACV